jgi:hypothetical protein
MGVTKDGTHAQYLVADLNSLSEKPSLLSMEEASAVGVPYLAAWSALVDAADIQAGETVLITGVCDPRLFRHGHLIWAPTRIWRLSSMQRRASTSFCPGGIRKSAGGWECNAHALGLRSWARRCD